MLIVGNRGALLSEMQLEGPANPPNLQLREQVDGREKPRSGALTFLRSPAAAVIESALLILLIGWIDYVTDFNVTVFYFVPVVLATWRAGRRAGWFIAALCGATVLTADLMVPHNARVIAFSYVNAGILVLASTALAELVISSRHAHERLKALLALKIVSLAEIHHRVKNNLQIVSSLLKLQSGKFGDPAVREVFTECRDRINAMARLHEQLYDQRGQSHLDFAPHLRELSETLLRSHTPAGCKLALNICTDSVPLNLDQSILLSLIANELLLNALKHAFHGRAKGKLDAELRTIGDRVTITIRDDGNGFVSVGAETSDQRGTGMDLVKAMSRQLGGEFVVNATPGRGTCATISFPSRIQTTRSSPLTSPAVS